MTVIERRPAAPFTSRAYDAPTPVTEDPDLTTVVGLLDDACVRTILTATSVEPMSANELASRCEVSRQTVYRRLDQLEAAGFVAERTRPREDGHHEAVYAATVEEISVRLCDGDLEFEVERPRRDAADELERLWRDF